MAIKYVKLGKSPIEISNMAFGCWAIIGGFNWGVQDKKDSIEALNAAYDVGITFYDTAEAYGDGKSEQLLSEVFADKRDKVVIASKVLPENYEPQKLVQACERSLQNLKSDWIDLYQLHWPNPQYPVEETLGVMEKLKKQGKIREYGVSNFGVMNLTECKEAGYTLSSNQLSYSLLFRAIEFKIKPFCLQNSIGMLCYSPLMQGLLTGKFFHAREVPDERARTRHFSSKRPQARHGEIGCEKETFGTIEEIRKISKNMGISMADISLAWLMSQDGVTSVLMSGRTAGQVKENSSAAEIILPPETIKKLNQVTKSLKEKMGPNADLWQGANDSRIT